MKQKPLKRSDEIKYVGLHGNSPKTVRVAQGAAVRYEIDQEAKKVKKH